MKDKLSKIITEGVEGIKPETLEKISQLFTEQVDALANEKAELQVKAALLQQDEEHGQKLEQIYEAFETSAGKKLQFIVESLEKKYSEKLAIVVQRHRQIVKEEAQKFAKEMNKNVSDFLDIYLQDTVPTETIQEAVKNTHATRLLEKVKSALAIDEALVNESIREAVVDGKAQIDQLREENEKIKAQNYKLLSESRNEQVGKFLTEKTKGFPKEKRVFIERTLSEKPLSFIRENFDYAVKLYEKNELRQRNKEAETVTKTKRGENAKDTVDNATLINESNKTQKTDVKTVPAAPALDAEVQEYLKNMGVGR